MSLPRLYNPDLPEPGCRLELGPEQARYLGRVLRLRTGDVLRVFNGEQGEFDATVERFSRDSAVLRIGVCVARPAEPALSLHLVQGVSRGERMDFVVQKATELGVAQITPVLTEYGVVRLDAGRAEKRRLHWQKVAISACEQSGRIRVPAIGTPIPLKNFFGANEAVGLGVVLDPAATEPFTRLAPPAAGLTLLIGPEGGLSPAELEDATLAGFARVALGPRILRTETAAVAALAIAQAFWGDLGAA